MASSRWWNQVVEGGFAREGLWPRGFLVAIQPSSMWNIDDIKQNL